MLHYYAKDFFAPLLVSPYEENGFVFVTIVSDLSQTLNLTLKISVFQWSSLEPKFSKILNFTQVSIKMHYKISYTYIFFNASNNFILSLTFQKLDEFISIFI